MTWDDLQKIFVQKYIQIIIITKMEKDINVPKI